MSMSYLECPVSLLTGATSAGSSASVKREKSLGTSHMKILPSSEPDAMMRSLKGCLVATITTSVNVSPSALAQPNATGRGHGLQELRKDVVRTSRYPTQQQCAHGTVVSGRVACPSRSRG